MTTQEERERLVARSPYTRGQHMSDFRVMPRGGRETDWWTESVKLYRQLRAAKNALGEAATALAPLAREAADWVEMGDTRPLEDTRLTVAHARSAERALATIRAALAGAPANSDAERSRCDNPVDVSGRHVVPGNDPTVSGSRGPRSIAGAAEKQEPVAWRYRNKLLAQDDVTVDPADPNTWSVCLPKGAPSGKSEHYDWEPLFTRTVPLPDTTQPPSTVRGATAEPAAWVIETVDSTGDKDGNSFTTNDPDKAQRFHKAGHFLTPLYRDDTKVDAQGNVHEPTAAGTEFPEQPAGKGEDAPALLARLRDNAALWAAEFRLTALRLGYSDMDDGWLIGWFANAIENTEMVRRSRWAASAPPPPTGGRTEEGWRPIDSAPKDGTRFLAFAPGHEIMLCQWAGHGMYRGPSWMSNNVPIVPPPTLWQPSPAVPKAAAI